MKTRSDTELALLRCLEASWQNRQDVSERLTSALLGVYEAKTLDEARKIALGALRAERKKKR